MSKLLMAGIFVALTVMAPMSRADIMTYNLSYSGSTFGNTATGTGSITLDTALLPNPGSAGNVPAATFGITAFSITVAGASAGNGTFGLADVTNWVWVSSAPLNFGAELVGQAGFDDFNWCANLFVGCVSPAPGGIGPFTIRANAETGDMMRLTSMTPVPEPGSVALLGIALVGTVAAIRRRARKSVDSL